MGKDKLKRFAEMALLPNVIQTDLETISNDAFELKGRWSDQFFENKNPIVLELGCGKGEYTVGLAQLYPDKNFIGVDIKGARMWRGAKDAMESSLRNVAFLRTRIEFIDAFFDSDEVTEIWITFPDPQLKERRTKKRLTSPSFLERYKKFLTKEGLIHLKTDSDVLHNYTLEILNANNYTILDKTNDLYNLDSDNDITRIEARSFQTFYESGYLAKNKTITYIRFKLTDEII